MAIAICKIILQQWIRGLLHHVYGELVLTRTCKMDLANHQRDLIFHDLSFGGSCASMVFVAATLLVLVTSLNHWLSGSQLLSALRHRHGLVTKLRPSSPTSRQSMPPLLVSGDDDDDEALTARCSLESEVRLHLASSSPHDRPRRAAGRRPRRGGTAAGCPAATASAGSPCTPTPPPRRRTPAPASSAPPTTTAAPRTAPSSGGTSPCTALPPPDQALHTPNQSHRRRR